MSKKLLILIAVVVLPVMLLASCRVRASMPPESTPTTAAGIPFPVDEGEDQDLISEILTQTAAVGGGAPEQDQTQATPEPAGEAEEPATGEEQGQTGGIPEPETQDQPQEPVALPTLTRPSTYTLQRGEWPICIARRYDLPMSTLLSINNLSMNSQLPAGTTLQIPQSGNWDPAHGARSLKTHPTNYTVQAGDTIYSIACAFGAVSPEAIIAVNGLQSPYTLTAGQTLQIP